MKFSSDYDKLAYHLSKRDNIKVETALQHVNNFASKGAVSPEGVAEILRLPRDCSIRFPHELDQPEPSYEKTPIENQLDEITQLVKEKKKKNRERNTEEES